MCVCVRVCVRARALSDVDACMRACMCGSQLGAHACVCVCVCVRVSVRAHVRVEPRPHPHTPTPLHARRTLKAESKGPRKELPYTDTHQAPHTKRHIPRATYEKPHTKRRNQKTHTQGHTRARMTQTKPKDDTNKA